MLHRLFGGGSAVPEVSAEEAKHRHDAGAMLVDVREAEEWADGHVRGAVHIPLWQLSARIDEIPQNKDVLLICRSGNRSRVGAEHLQRAGRERVSNVAGGISAWRRSGLPIERS